MTVKPDALRDARGCLPCSAPFVRVSAMKKEMVIAGFLVTLGAGVAVGIMVGSSADSPSTAPTPPAAPVVAAPDPAPSLPEGFVDSESIPLGDSPARGGATAPVTLVMFTEFECGFCARASTTVRALEARYGEDLRVVFKHRPMTYHQSAAVAAQAALAAHAQGKFWAYHDSLFADWTALSRADLESKAASVGLDVARFKADLDSNAHDARLQQDVALADQLDAVGAPTFFINGVKLAGNKPIEAFAEIIDKELVAGRGSTYAARVAANYTAPVVVKQPARRDQGPVGRPPGNGDPVVYKVPVGDAPIKGPKDAIVTIVEFSEFQCPYCSKVFPTLQGLLGDKKYKDKVRIAFKHRPLSFHERARPAAKAAMAAHAQGKFWEYHDRLFSTQSTLEDTDLEGHANALGLDMVRWKADYTSSKFDAGIDADDALGIRVGASGTPHFFVNGVRIKGSKDLAYFQKMVDDAIDRAKPLTAKGLRGDALYDAIIKDAAETYVPVLEDDDGPPQAPTGPVTIDIREGVPTDGPADAKVTIVEFSDFQCPFCSKAIPTMKALKKKYGDDLRLAFMHLPLAFHEHANLAAQASLAAGEQGKFWEYHDLLFENQTALTQPDLEKYAAKLDLDMGKFKAALASKKFQAHIEKDMEEARQAGASGTPTFYVNGTQLVGAQPQDAFEKAIDAALAEAP